MSNDKSTSTPVELEQLRGEIDTIDRELLRLINARARVAIEVGKVKRQYDDDPKFYRPEREAQILRAYAENNQGPLSDSEASRIMREVMSACLALEHPLKIAFLGPAGTYTHIAALKHFGGSISDLPLASIEEIVQAVEVSRADFGVVPLENSLEGSVNQTLDCLVESNLNIFGEVNVEIEHQLLSKSESLSDIKVVQAHPQALAQCRRWLDKNLPGAERVSSPSNAEGARLATENPGFAAIASKRAAELYDLKILRSNIEDGADNTTRFVILSRHTCPPSGEDITSIVFTTKNEPGALHDVLQLFGDAGVSLTRIESRPLRQGRWEYIFFIDVEGHIETEPLKDVWPALDRLTGILQLLGSYPRALNPSRLSALQTS